MKVKLLLITATLIVQSSLLAHGGGTFTEAKPLGIEKPASKTTMEINSNLTKCITVFR